MATSKKTNNLAILGTAGVGIALAGTMAMNWSKDTQSIQTADIANLPAVNARLDSLETRMDKEIDAINAQINRREVENIQYVDTLDYKMEKKVDSLDARLNRLEELFLDPES